MNKIQMATNAVEQTKLMVEDNLKKVYDSAANLEVVYLALFLVHPNECSETEWQCPIVQQRQQRTGEHNVLAQYEAEDNHRADRLVPLDLYPGASIQRLTI